MPTINKWDKRVMELTETVAGWSSCYQENRHVGAIIVKDKRVMTTGYNGAPAGIKSCAERGECFALLGLCQPEQIGANRPNGNVGGGGNRIDAEGRTEAVLIGRRAGHGNDRAVRAAGGIEGIYRSGQENFVQHLNALDVAGFDAKQYELLVCQRFWGDGDISVLQRLTEHLGHLLSELGKLVQE